MYKKSPVFLRSPSINHIHKADDTEEVRDHKEQAEGVDKIVKEIDLTLPSRD